MPAIPEYFRRIGRRPLYPQLWRGCVGAWCPSLGPTGATLRDWSGFGNHGTLTNFTLANAWAVSGGQQSLLLDGTDDNVVLPDLTARIGTEITMSTWCCQLTNVGSDRAICVYSGLAVSPFIAAYIGSRNTSKFGYYLSFSDNTSYLYQAGTAVVAGTWFHVAMTYDGVQSNFYTNGVITNTATHSKALKNSASSSFIGRDRAAGTEFFPGHIDDVRYYNRALTPSEIQLLYSGGQGRGIAYTPYRRRFWPVSRTGSLLLLRRRRQGVMG